MLNQDELVKIICRTSGNQGLRMRKANVKQKGCVKCFASRGGKHRTFNIQRSTPINREQASNWGEIGARQNPVRRASSQAGADGIVFQNRLAGTLAPPKMTPSGGRGA